MGWGGGTQKADHQGCREQTRYLEVGGGAKRETRGAIRCWGRGDWGNQGKSGLRGV